MKPKKMLLCGNRTTSYDDTMLSGLGKALERKGVDVIILLTLLEPPLLASFCRHNAIDTVFEINRSRNQVLELPSDVVHIAWIQDVIKDSRQGLDESNLIYFLTNPEILGYENISLNDHCKLLYTGVDEEECHKLAEHISDFSFVGYMPPPINNQLLNAPMMLQLQQPTIGQVVEKFIARYRLNNEKLGYSDMRYHRVDELVKEILAQDFGISPHMPYKYNDIIQGFYQHIVRSVDRIQLLNTVLKISSSMRIYGGPEWCLWENYKLYYQRYLETSKEVYQVFRTTKVNLHNNPNGFGLHSRVLDCMGCGGTIFVNESPSDSYAGGIATVFEPWVDYIPYSFSNLGQLASEWLQDSDKRKSLGSNAQKKILAAHTWNHRAEGLLADLNHV